MGELSKYRVILGGKVIPEHDRVKVLEGLADLFHSRTDTMEKLLQGKETPLKKAYDEEQAALICQKIRKAGAECKVEIITETAPDSADDALYPLLAPGKCPSCQNRLHRAVLKCPVCGFSNAAEEPADKSADDHTEYDGPPDAQPGGEKLQSLIMRFVRSNTDYYRQQFSRFGSPEAPSFKLTWHWPAFFFFFLWALYRKMWGWAAIHMLLGIGLILWLKPGGLVYLLWIFLWTVTANYLYFRRVAKNAGYASADAVAERQFLDNSDVSKSAVWMGVLIAMVLSVFVGNLVTVRFLEQYGDRIKDVLPGSGSQIRPDGSPLTDIAKNTSEAKSSLILSWLGTSLKILLVVDKGENNQQAITHYVDKINNGLAKDAWGSPIRVEQHVDRYVFVSAGPDRVFKTSDDMLQPVIIP